MDRNSIAFIATGVKADGWTMVIGGSTRTRILRIRRIFAGGEAPLPIRAAARDVLQPLPLVANVFVAQFAHGFYGLDGFPPIG